MPRKVTGVSRLTEPGLKEELASYGVEAIAADLMNEADLAKLPDARNVLYLAGTKFGTTGKRGLYLGNECVPARPCGGKI